MNLISQTKHSHRILVLLLKWIKLLYTDVVSGSLSQCMVCLRYVYTLRLIGPISYLDACYTYDGNKMYAFVRKWRCTFVGEQLNHIHRDTKSARLIAVCKCSFTKCFHCKLTATLYPVPNSVGLLQLGSPKSSVKQLGTHNYLEMLK